MSVYEKKELIKQNFLQKIFKILPKENFLIEVQNLFSENEGDLLKIEKTIIENLKKKYKVSRKAFLREREFLLDKYLSYCLWDEHLSSEEKKVLEYLTILLSLDVKYLDKRIDEEGKNIYRKKVQFVIKDNLIEDAEKEELDTLEKEFNISEDDSTEILSNEVSRKVQTFVNNLLEKRRISPDEEKELNDMISGLHVNASFTGDGIEKFRKYWDIENAELVPIQPNINLQKNEILYYFDKINWYEERSRTKYVSYGGLSTNFRICKGVSIRAGGIAPSRETEQYMKHIDSGTVFFTNKRIIFMGNHGNKLIPFTKILSFTPYTNGIEIGKDSGKQPFFECNDSELMGIYLARLLKDF